MLFQFTGQWEETVRMGFNLVEYLTMRTSLSGQFSIHSWSSATGTAQILILFEYFRTT